MTVVLDRDQRAALLRAARGERASTGPVRQGIRVVTPPARPAADAEVAPARATKPTTTPTTKPTTEPTIEVAAAEPAGVIEQLLAGAETSTSPRVRTLAARIRELLAELEGRLATAVQEAQAEQQVAELRRQLAEAEQRLRTLRWGDSPPATSAKPATRSAKSTRPGPRTVSTEEMRAARQWAAANGVECSTTGRVAARVIEAWRAATAGGDPR